METVNRPYPANTEIQGSATAAHKADVENGEALDPKPVLPKRPRSVALRWLLHDIPYIAMLLLALAGVVLRLPVLYWVILTPIFGIISIASGWSRFDTPAGRRELVFKVALDWCALLLAIYLLYNRAVQGTMNADSTPLEMMTLLALGTFVAGVQARVWRICAVGGALFLAVPALGWLDQSPVLLIVGTCLIIALGGVAWWMSYGRQS